MSPKDEVEYISDAEGHPTGVIVPIDLWHEIASERETAYLLKSEVMRERLMAAMGRNGGLSLEEVEDRFGI